jgi:hypothetical protein
MSNQENADIHEEEGKNNNADDELSVDNVRLARTIVSSLVEKGIKVLALDFDKTIVAIHTAGFWTQPTSKLVEHVRPCFKALIQAGLDTRLHLCVVTYSMQPALIRDVIRMALPRSDTDKILIRANSKDWLPPQSPTGQAYGKQQHIAWIVTELFNKKHAIIHPEEILLLDDDSDNVEIAHQFGHQAYEVPEEVSLEDINSFVENLPFIRHEIATT